MTSYKVTLYFSSFCTYYIEAEDEIGAITEARSQPIDNDELLSNLESWTNADEVTIEE